MDIQHHYIEQGQGEPLVLLHGNGESGDYFAHQMEAFSRRYHVYAPDTRGHGGTPRGNAPFTIDQFAADLAGFLDRLSIPKAHILGFSDGANIAMVFAMNWPDRVGKLILDGGNLDPSGVTAACTRWIQREYRAAKEKGDAGTIELMELMLDQPHIPPAHLARITAPTLVMAGNRDVILREHTKLIARSIPGAKLTILQGDHFIAAKHPEEFNRAVLEFLEG